VSQSSRARAGLTIVCVVVLGAGCMASLHPRTTLAGQYFPAERVAEVRQGMSSLEVRAILGEPVEALQLGDVTALVYFERYQPRGCTDSFLGIPLSRRPVLSARATITIRSGVVLAVQTGEQAPTGQSNGVR
jgi:hypothetical protein